MNQLEAALSQLATLLDKYRLIQAQVFQLPEVAPGEEHQPISFIPVTPLQGKEAHQAAIQAFRRFYGHSGAATKTPYRLPGILQYQGNGEAVAAQVDRINRLKDQFKACVQSLGSRTQKFETLHALFPMLITLQVYRHIKCIIQRPNTVRFIWAHKSVVSKVSRDQIVEMLTQQLEQPPQHLINSEEWQRNVTRELNEVLRLAPDIELRLRRDIKVQPLVNLQYPNNQQPLTAPLPLLIIDEDPQPIPVGALADYDSERPRHRPQPRRTDPHPLVERIGLYRYLGD